jgi:2-polyprenyl-3-methyl-5-hydroxy-6-metoxy-1,4-benzoquinol methylase
MSAFSNLLTRLLGFTATVIHGDTFVLDRWLWICRRLPITRNGERLLDVGCGSGAFTIGGALRGYEGVGISWDTRNQSIAAERADILRAKTASFDVGDVRELGTIDRYRNAFDILLCLECIEHICDDRKLMRDMALCLKPGGRLYLTTPYFYFPPVSSKCYGPFTKVEDGSHVRRGYTAAMLTELCELAGLQVEDITYCSGAASRFVTRLFRALMPLGLPVAWLLTLPLRPFPPVLDPIINRLLRPRQTSICLEAYKPRFSSGTDEVTRRN